MEKGWKQVLLTAFDYKAEMDRSILEENGIKAVILNQKDSAYKIFGDYSVYAGEEFESEALELLKDLKN
jgi:hypothetical protein